jgi:hypothetical protein
MIGSMFRKAWYSDSATLNLDFTTGVLDPRLTFTRTSTVATYINSSGLIATASNNVARFDHDPNTLAPRGLLIEAAATNLFNWSETFATTGGATNWNWSVNVTRGTPTTTNPTGASGTVIKVEETTANGLHTTLIVPTVLASTTYTFSVWAKAVERTFVQLLENGGSGANSMVNLSTGSIVSESTSGITTVTAFGTTGWYRISMRLTTIVGQTTANCQLRLSTNGTTTSYAGTTGSGIYIWGAQLETGSGASSYIPTGASTVTRNADECSMTGTNFSDWYNQSEGTLLVKWKQFNVGLNEFAIAARFGLSSGITNSLWIAKQNTASLGQRIEFEMRDSSGTQRVVSAANPVTDAIITAAGAQKFGDTFGMSYNGNTTVSTAQTRTPAPDRLFIGSYDLTSGHINSTISQLKYWPTRLPNATLQSLTT